MPEVQEGIYLEVKQGTVGTGSTASRMTFRNFYAVCVAGSQADLHLLDDRLGLTGIKETVSTASFPSRLSHQPKLEPYFVQLRPRLGTPAPPQTRPPVAPPAPRPVAGLPQERPVAAVPQERPVAKPPQARAKAQPPAEPKTAGWWDLTSRGSDQLIKK